MEQESIIFTDAAANKVGALLQDEDNNAMHLRVYVSGGGCAGFQYGFSFDESKDESDTMVEKNGVKLVVDPMSIQYLLGAEIALADAGYNVEDLYLMGGGAAEVAIDAIKAGQWDATFIGVPFSVLVLYILIRAR